jgi:hypothetical protein
MTIRPKTFRAAKDFNHDARDYRQGDVVEGLALGQLLQFGDMFVVADPTHDVPTPPAQPVPQATTTAATVADKKVK